MARRWSRLFVLVALAAAACSTGASDMNSLAESIRRTNCGLSPAVTSYLRGRGSDQAPRSGGPIRACELPTAEDIASACASPEGVPIPDSKDPDNPGAPRYSFPAYSVRAAACTFADPGETIADCTFELLSERRAPAQVRTRLTFRFRNLSNNLIHNHYHARWEVDGICAPR